MNILLKKENILYDSVMNKESDRDSLSAFHDYTSFLSDEGIPLINHVNPSIKERNKEEKEYQDLYIDILKKIKEDTLELEKFIKKLGLEEDIVLKERFQCLFSFLEGNTISIGVEALENPNMDFNDILRKLDELGYRKEISKYIILSTSSTPFIKDSVTFKDKKKYYSLKEAFAKKHSTSLIGALISIMRVLGEINNSESTTVFPRNSYIGDLEKVHNSIKINNLDSVIKGDVSGNQIFFMKGEEIHHYEIGLLTYNLINTKDPKYISMFKNIIRYMPLGKKRIRVGEFEKLMLKNERVGDVYRDNLGNIGKPFRNFLKKNGVHNVHPNTKKPVIKVTKEYIDFHNMLNNSN